MNIEQKTQRTWQLTMALYFCLLAGILLDHLALRPIFHWPVWLIQTSLLLPLLSGLLKKLSRSAIWLCFVLLLYFLIYVQQAALVEANRTAYISLAMLCVTLFTTSMLFARWRKQLDYQQQPADAAEDLSP